LSTDIIVRDGANNDLESAIRGFSPSESIYLYSRNGKFSVGDQFSIVRPAEELFRTTRYNGEHWSIHALGNPYEDVGRVQVTQVTSKGAVAEVSFTCGPIYPGDLALPYQPRPIPNYVPAELDRFVPPDGKIQGTITAARSNFASLGKGDIVYLNFGGKQGAQVGQKYRVYYTVSSRGHGTVLARHPIPRETVGEIVVLSAQEKSSVAIVVNCTRDINVGYGVELE
jgi:hypothetical protein